MPFKLIGGRKYGWLAIKVRTWLGVPGYEMSYKEFQNLEKETDNIKDFTEIYEKKELDKLKKEFPLRSVVEMKPDKSLFSRGGIVGIDISFHNLMNTVGNECFVVGWKMYHYKPMIKVLIGGEEELKSASEWRVKVETKKDKKKKPKRRKI